MDDYFNRIFPSNIAVDKNNKAILTVGKYGSTDCPPDVLCIHDNKRIIGRTGADGQLRRDIATWGLPFELDNHDEPFCVIHGENVRPIEFTALLLKRCQHLVEKNTGEVPQECVITVPAYFSDAQRRATRDAAKIAGLQVIRTITEPTAILISCLRDHDQEGVFLVIDIGGGTLDASKVELTISDGQKNFVVRAISGHRALGGQDFTHALCRLFRNRFKKDLVDIPKNELMAICERAKRQLDDPITIDVRGKRYSIERRRYNDSLHPHMKRVEMVIEDVLGDDSIQGVILAGGASYEQVFQDIVKEKLKGIPFLPLRRPPAEVVAEGAAIMARTSGAPIVTEVLSQSLGIRLQDKRKRKTDIMGFQIRRNSALPASATMEYTGVHEEETEIALFEGESPKASENNFLGSYFIDAPGGVQFEVTIEVTCDAEIIVSARIKGAKEDSGSGLEVRRGDSWLTDDELHDMREAANRRFGFHLLASSTPALASSKKRKSRSVSGRGGRKSGKRGRQR